MLEGDFADFDAGQFLPVADRAVVALAAFEFEGNNFGSLAFGLEDLGGYFGALDQRFADFQARLVGGKEHFVEGRLLAGFDAEQLDVDNVTGLHAELSTAGLDNCVSHSRNLSNKGSEKLTPSRLPRKGFSRGLLICQPRTPGPPCPIYMKAALFLALLALAGCATTSQVDPRVVDQFAQRGVSGETLLKVREGLPLTVAQVAESTRAGVPGPGLISYLQSTRKAYNLSNADITRLRAAGAPPEVITYMQRSYHFYTKGPDAVSQDHPYFAAEKYDRYGGAIQAPFAYAPPQIDTFFDSGYEESLYSPFSFD